MAVINEYWAIIPRINRYRAAVLLIFGEPPEGPLEFARILFVGWPGYKELHTRALNKKENELLHAGVCPEIVAQLLRRSENINPARP